MEINIEQVPGMRLAYVRHTGSYSDFDGIRRTWEKLFAWEDENKIPGTIPGKSPVPIGISHDDPGTVPPEHCRYDASILVADSVTESDGMPIQVIPEGKYACYIHLGDYKTIGDSLNKMVEWIKENDLVTRPGPFLEFHLDQPGEAPPDKIRTKLCIPVK